MCGIAGLTTYQLPDAEQNLLLKMGQAIKHRGPDAGDIFVEPGVGLCHRRLSIIDLSEAGNQPMFSVDGRYVIVFNGEIYNFLEQREKLVSEGIEFKTQTDTEVILALYEKYKEGCLQYLNGMFAFAIWDKDAKSLFLARDRVGKKPLYYCDYSTFYNDSDNNKTASAIAPNILFASELKALFEFPGFPKKVRLDALYDFFAYQYVPDPKTILEGVHKLEPGHFLVVNEQGFRKEKYWDVSFAAQADQSEAEIKSTLITKLHHYTRNRMISDVPLGAFLSGGVDSSGIVALMALNSEKPVTTCSIGFDEKRFNETEFAQLVADRYNTRHFELTVHANVADNLEKIVAFFDEPFADPSLVPTFFVSQLAREKVTVAIAGDGGDEVFAGYEKYGTDRIENIFRDMIPEVIRCKFFPSVVRLLRKFNTTLTRRAASLLHSLSLPPDLAFYISNSQISDDIWQMLAKSDTKQRLGSYHPSSITTDFYQRADGKDHVSKILYTDMKTYLPGGILVKVDRMSMANSLEVRAPILDFEVMEYAAKIPSKFKLNQGEKKYILREVFRDMLPDDILDRKKMGFSVPLATWLRSEIKSIAEARLLDRTSGLIDYFEIRTIKRLWQEHQSGEFDHSNVLWSMLMFQMWWDRYMNEVNGERNL